MSDNITNESKVIARKLYDIIQNKNSNPAKLFYIIRFKTDPANIDCIINEYEKITKGNNLQDDINQYLNFHLILKYRIKSILNYYLHFEHLKTRIKNPYWEGEFFDVVRNGSIITISGSSTRRINLAALLKNFKSSSSRRKFVYRMENFPGEILMDIAAEQSSFNILSDKKGYVNLGKGINALAFYEPTPDAIAIFENSSDETIVHELGHAVDYLYIQGENKSSAATNKKFCKIFDEEIKIHKEELLNIQDPRKKISNNKKEMIAICYTLLMLGYCEEQTTITKYFPNTLNFAKELIISNRTKKLQRRIPYYDRNR
ncbi:hypothetical protein IJ182_10920 [bacterium]|nr:hypothetical protein [bacterium]